MNFTKKITQGPLLFDGGFGTMLYAAGFDADSPTELANLARPELVTQIHSQYIAAGAEVVTTNTFGVNSLKYDGLEGRPSAEMLVCSALDCARAAVQGQDRPVFVALDVGPLGRLVEGPDGVDLDTAISAFADTVAAAAKHGGADLVLIETMTDLAELRAAVLGAKSVCDLPIVATVVFDSDGRMLSGADPHTVVTLLEGLGVTALGTNCSLGPDAMLELLPRLLERASLPVIAQPNAGLPRVENGVTVYDVSPRRFAELTAEMLRLGAHGIGGCCGTTPEFTALMRAAAEGIVPPPLTDKKTTAICSRTRTLTIGQRPYLVGERINPTGKPHIKEALRSGDYAAIISEGLGEEEAGAHVLDVNAGLAGIDEDAALETIVSRLSRLTPLPLQVDTSDSVAMERALKCYCGIALINSVNGKRESLDAVLPLVKRYGGVVVGLTLDENGIPDSVEGRVAIAKRIIAAAEDYGIAATNVVIDPLTLTVSTDPRAARVTLDTVAELTRMGIHTMLGVSNVSFGLPARDALNSAFFTLALSSGLSLAIMNPCSTDMQKAYHTYLALSGLDEGFRDYIEFAADLPTAAAAAATPREQRPAEQGSPLHRAIVKGMADAAVTATEQLLAAAEPLDVIKQHIIPALDTVGAAFEAKKMFLPQLLMSSDAASAAFGRIRSQVEARSGGQPAGEKIILATVKGDIHDIGKNIVRMLLENYGYTVIDLGRDVSYETILDSTKQSGARLVGLSALMTTTLPAMRQTVSMLHEACPDCRIMVGGAVLNEEFAREMRADFYAPDAMAAVRIAESVFAQ